jgi:hypothetical protein
VTPVAGLLVLEGWEGSSVQSVAVIGMTPHRFRIQALTRTRLAGRGRYLEIGEVALVPKTAVRITGALLCEEKGGGT